MALLFVLEICWLLLSAFYLIPISPRCEDNHDEMLYVSLLMYRVVSLVAIAATAPFAHNQEDWDSKASYRVAEAMGYDRGYFTQSAALLNGLNTSVGWKNISMLPPTLLLPFIVCTSTGSLSDINQVQSLSLSLLFCNLFSLLSLLFCYLFSFVISSLCYLFSFVISSVL